MAQLSAYVGEAVYTLDGTEYRFRLSAPVRRDVETILLLEKIVGNSLDGFAPRVSIGLAGSMPNRHPWAFFFRTILNFSMNYLRINVKIIKTVSKSFIFFRKIQKIFSKLKSKSLRQFRNFNFFRKNSEIFSKLTSKSSRLFRNHFFFQKNSANFPQINVKAVKTVSKSVFFSENSKKFQHNFVAPVGRVAHAPAPPAYGIGGDGAGRTSARHWNVSEN